LVVDSLDDEDGELLTVLALLAEEAAPERLAAAV
jgi:hypothetical protein